MNKILMFLLLFPLSVICSPILAQDSLAKQIRTSGLLNGRAWEKVQYDDKTLFLAGLVDGITMFFDEYFIIAKNEKEEIKITKVFMENVHQAQLNDIIQPIDAFYADRTNIRIPIAYAYKYVLMKIKGASPKELDEYASKLRRNYNNAE